MKKPLVIALAVAGTVLLAGGGGAWWWHSRQAPAEAGAAPAPRHDVEYRYVTLDKTIVMLRPDTGGNHYLALDLVFKTPVKKERETKDHLPLLRTIVVKAMSAHTMESANKLGIEQFTREINDAFRKSYAAEQAEPPFDEALIAKLIIE